MMNRIDNQNAKGAEGRGREWCVDRYHQATNPTFPKEALD